MATLLSALPVYWRKPQSPPVHFFAEFVGILLHRLADQTITPASLYVGYDLLPNAFIIKDETLVFCIVKNHQARPASIPTYLYDFTCFRLRLAGGYQQYLRWGGF